MRTAIVVLAVLACARTLAADAPATSRQELAAKLMKDVRPPDGFDATIFATPEEANYPVFVAATPEGTLFVSSDGNGSLGRDPHRGRILRLRDTDGDGACDEVQTFVADLDSPRGLLFVDDRLLVLHPPHVTSFRDADGDGVADERTLLVRGIAFDYSRRPADHTTNGLDLFARGTRNNLEAAVGPLLDIITRDNTNDGGGWNVRLHAFTGLEDHGYPRRYMHFADEIVAPLADYGGGSGTGACWIDEPWMPPRFNDAAFTCDWGRGEIYRHAVTAKGAGYEATQETFLGLTRATDLDVDSTGHIYAASWRNGLFTWAGPGVGFIVRLVPKGVTSQTVPDFAQASADELITILGGPSHRLRLAAQRAILARQLVDEAATGMEILAADSRARPASRVAAIFTLALGQQGRAVPILVKLAADPSAAAWAVRALGDLAGDGVAVPQDVFQAALRSADSRTRKEAAVATVRLNAAASPAALMPLTADADPIVAHTAVEGLVRLAGAHEADVIAACTQALDDPATQSAVHRAAARVLGEIHSDAAADAVLTRLAESRDAARGGDLAWAAARLWQRESAWTGESWGTQPDTRGPYYALERWFASDRLQSALLEAVKTCEPAALPALARTLGLHRLPGDAVMPRLLARSDSTAALVTFLEASEAAPPGGGPTGSAGERGGHRRSRSRGGARRQGTGPRGSCRRDAALGRRLERGQKRDSRCGCGAAR